MDGDYFTLEINRIYSLHRGETLVYLHKFIVIVSRHILRVAEMEAKRFPCMFLISCEFPVGVWVVVVVGNFPRQIHKRILKNKLEIKIVIFKGFFSNC